MNRRAEGPATQDLRGCVGPLRSARLHAARDMPDQAQLFRMTDGR